MPNVREKMRTTNTKYLLNRLLLLCVLGLVPAVATANTIIPAPLVWLGISGAENVFRYILSVTLICVGVEAAIYKYFPRFQHPIRDSIVANVVSTICGVPLAIMSAVMLNDPFIIATGLSIVIEFIVIDQMEKANRKAEKKSFLWPVILANVVSNAMIAVLLVWKSGGFERN